MYILMLEHFCFKKLSHCHQYISWLLASNLVLFLNCSQFFGNLSLPVLKNMFLRKKKLHCQWSLRCLYSWFLFVFYINLLKKVTSCIFFIWKFWSWSRYTAISYLSWLTFDILYYLSNFLAALSQRHKVNEFPCYTLLHIWNKEVYLLLP